MAELEDEFGDIISKARSGLGYTIDYVADKTGLSSRFIEKAERYQVQPDSEQVMALARVLSLSSDKLAAIALESWQPPEITLPKQPMLVESIFVHYGAFGENCYILACVETRKAAVVDPGGSVDEILKRLSDLGLSLEIILITHAHGDHVGGVNDLGFASKNIRLIAHPSEWKPIPRNPSIIPVLTEDNDQVLLGKLYISALHTPGHTPGSTCYYAERVCFVGDTLFAGSIGRPAGHQVYDQMLKSIRENILSLPNDTIILPGHGPATTVAEEKAHNPFF